MFPAGPVGTGSCSLFIIRYTQGIVDDYILLQSGRRVGADVVGSSMEGKDLGGIFV